MNLRAIDRNRSRLQRGGVALHKLVAVPDLLKPLPAGSRQGRHASLDALLPAMLDKSFQRRIVVKAPGRMPRLNGFRFSLQPLYFILPSCRSPALLDRAFKGDP